LPRAVAPVPRTATSHAPSLDQVGWTNSPLAGVSRSGAAPPADRARQRSPPCASSQVANAIQAPSGDQAGDSSRTPLRGASSGSAGGPRLERQSGPKASNTTVEPSGDVAGQRANRVATGPEGSRRATRVDPEIVRWTRAVNGIVSTTPSASRR